MHLHEQPTRDRVSQNIDFRDAVVDVGDAEDFVVVVELLLVLQADG